MAGRFGAAVAVAALLLLVAAGPAVAHTGGDADVVLTLDPLPPALDGIDVSVVNRLAPQLVLSNPTDAVVEVVGLEDRPFLRIGPDGVEANLAVAEWYTTNDPFGSAAPLPDVVGGDDLWGQVAEEPSWGWFDHRLHPGPLQAPAEIVAIGEPADFDRWSVGLLVDGDPVVVEGSFRYQPLRGGFVPSITTPPQVDGVDVAVLPGLVPGLFLDNRSGEVVTVLGADGEPFLRFDPDVGTEANVASPSWVASARAQEGLTPTDVVDPAAEPEWQVVARVPRYGWIEPRLSYPEREPDAEVIRAAAAVDVEDWTVSLRHGDGEEVALAGVITWQPNPDLEPAAAGPTVGTASRWAAVVAVAALAAGGAAVTARRARRSRAAQ